MAGKRYYVFSTLSNDQLYTQWIAQPEPQPPVKGEQVLVKGGYGIANDRLITSRGTVTEIDESQLAVLRQVPQFAHHEKAGFVVVQAKHAEPEKVASNMNRNDKSQPLTPSDYPGGPNGVTVVENGKGLRNTAAII